MPSQEGTAAPTAASLRSWRVETAVRVFALALSVGLVLSQRTLSEHLPLLAALTVIAVVTGTLSLNARGRWRRWNPATEALLVGVLLASGSTDAAALLPYLAVPPIIAGLHSGTVSTVNTACVSMLTYAVTLGVTPGRHLGEASEGLTWLFVGLGTGLLASWQSRALRDARERQAPHARAHELVSSLHGLARRGDVGLDPRLVAGDLAAGVRNLPGCTASAVFLDSGRPCPDLLASFGDTSGFAAHLASAPQDLPGSVAVVPLRSGPETIGHVVLSGPDAPPVEQAQLLADEYAVRLETADMFERVRMIATTEERHRIARDMHDGVAQEVVALGYVVDEIEDRSTEPEIHALASGLRDELTRVVTELRYSIFDLRHGVSEGSLSGALGEYVRRVGEDCGLEVHLLLDVSGGPLSPREETHLLRVAQEAISNVRKHARARQVWVTLVTDGSSILLQVEDDGVGNATQRAWHWGLESMRERAESVGATFHVGPRPGGGTVVRLERPAHSALPLRSPA